MGQDEGRDSRSKMRYNRNGRHRQIIGEGQRGRGAGRQIGRRADGQTGR